MQSKVFSTKVGVLKSIMFFVQQGKLGPDVNWLALKRDALFFVLMFNVEIYLVCSLLSLLARIQLFILLLFCFFFFLYFFFFHPPCFFFYFTIFLFFFFSFQVPFLFFFPLFIYFIIFLVFFSPKEVVIIFLTFLKFNHCQNAFYFPFSFVVCIVFMKFCSKLW